MDQLEQLFLTDGFSHHTLDGIVNELHCSKMTLYTLAPSREQIVLSVLRRFFEEADGRIERRVLGVTSPESRIRACVNASVTELAAMTPACFADVLDFETTRELYQRFAETNAERLRALLATKSGSGAQAHRRNAFLTGLVSVVLHEIYAGDFVQQTLLDKEQALEFLIDTVVAGVGSPKGAGQIERIK